MENITKNEMNVLLKLFKEIDVNYNANSLSKELGLTSMGALKILKKLEKEKVLESQQFGKAVFYKPNLDNSYARTFLKLILQKEAQQVVPRVKRWIKELRQFKDNSEIGILFGSVLNNEKYNDVDLLLILKQSQNKKINKLIEEMNKINVKKIHPIKQTKNDFKENLKKKNKVLLTAVKNGIIIFGYDKFIEIIKNVAR